MKVWCKDHGVRKYEYEIGRFTGIDPLWEKYIGWTPYQYSGNNPIMFLDWDGKADQKFESVHTGIGMEGVDKEVFEEVRDAISLPLALEALTIPFFGSKVVTKTLEAISKPINKLISKFVNKSDEVVEGVVKKGAEGAVEGGVEVAKTSSNVLLRTSTQLQAKFKHAGDFGVLGNYSKDNAAKFSSAINQHINSPGIKVIQGTYHKQPAIHYLNPNTGLNVISTPSGQFWSGWKLNPAQLQNVLKHGGL